MLAGKTEKPGFHAKGQHYLEQGDIGEQFAGQAIIPRWEHSGIQGYKEEIHNPGYYRT